MLQASECDRRGRTGFEEVEFPQLDYLMGALQAAQSIDAGAIAARCKEQPQRIAEAIQGARTEAVAAYVASANPTLN
jgi:tRNA nucleotidyltransferase (CCA-adding enzyme)